MLRKVLFGLTAVAAMILVGANASTAEARGGCHSYYGGHHGYGGGGGYYPAYRSARYYPAYPTYSRGYSRGPGYGAYYGGGYRSGVSFSIGF